MPALIDVDILQPATTGAARQDWIPLTTTSDITLDAITGRASEASIERSVGIPTGVLRSFFDEIAAAGYATRDGDTLSLTTHGTEQVQLITAAWRAWLVNELADWLPKEETKSTSKARVDAAIDRIVIRLVRENEQDPTQALN